MKRFEVIDGIIEQLNEIKEADMMNKDYDPYCNYGYGPDHILFVLEALVDVRVQRLSQLYKIYCGSKNKIGDNKTCYECLYFVPETKIFGRCLRTNRLNNFADTCEEWEYKYKE